MRHGLHVHVRNPIGIENYDYLVVNDTVDHASALIDQLICDEQSQNTGRDQAYRVSANIDFINQMRENAQKLFERRMNMIHPSYVELMKVVNDEGRNR